MFCEEEQITCTTDDTDVCCNIIEGLFLKYAGNEYMTQRLKYHVLNLLPSQLDSEDKNHEKRLVRNDYLSNEQKQFVQVFLSENRYYYLQSSNQFYYYDSKHYCIVREDLIHHQLLTNISKDRTLMDWKYKTKTNIMKQIKERGLFSSIPETETIQIVLNLLHPSLFATRTEAKYFLAILGDSILKKNNDTIYLVKPKTKKYITALETVASISIGHSNLFGNIITKFHENYKYEHCRLLKISNSLSIDIWHDILNKYGLDLMCVAAHYSTRFESAENYIQTIINDDDNVKQYGLLLCTNQPENIINSFCNKYIQMPAIEQDASAPVYSIQWKNMHYIWKQYLSVSALPNIVFSNTFKNILKERYTYDEETDSFCNVTSKYLPHTSSFIQFWNETIVTLNNNADDIENVLEIDEFCVLYKQWAQDNATINGNIGEIEIIKIISHFFASVEIIDNKFIMGVTCKLWDKRNDLMISLVSLKEHFNLKNKINDCDELIHFDVAYDYYTKIYSDKKSKNTHVVSKNYFEKFLCSKLQDYIEYDKFISSSWYI